MKKCLLLIIILLLAFSLIPTQKIVYAESLKETIESELNNLDLTELEDFFNNIIDKPDDVDFYTLLNGFIEGTYSINLNNIFSFVGEKFISLFYLYLPSLLSIVALSIVYGLLSNVKRQGDDTKNIVLFIIFCIVLITLIAQVVPLYNNTKNLIENISIFNEIMSPIMLSLMVASGGKVSASIFSPTVVFFSTGFINIILYLCLPLITLTCVFNLLSCFLEDVKFNKFAEFFNSVFKWVLGLLIAISGFFITLQGLNASIIDGVSIKAAKYTISNMVPIVGGFLSQGFDVVTCGVVIIKNVLGVSSIIGLFYMILSPVLGLLAFSFSLKIISALVEPFTGNKICDIFTCFIKAVTSLIACILSVGLIFFITIILILLCSNSFI